MLIKESSPRLGLVAQMETRIAERCVEHTPYLLQEHELILHAGTLVDFILIPDDKSRLVKLIDNSA